MKAFVEYDMIKNITHRGDTEIGNIPVNKKGIGLERLRFDGSKIVDLMDLTTIWVKPIGLNFFELHAIEVPGAQAIAMTYTQRKNIVLEKNVIRLRTTDEITQQAKDEKISMLKTRMIAALEREIGGSADLTIFLLGLITLLIWNERDTNAQIQQGLDRLLTELRVAFPAQRLQDILLNGSKALKTIMEHFYAAQDSVKSKQ